MSEVQATTHDFYGQQVDVVVADGQQFVILDQLCSHMMIDAESQRQGLSRQVWARGMTCVTQVMLSGAVRAYPRFLVNVKILGMWLANITTSRIADTHARKLVERFQIELTQKIHEWMTVSAPAPVELDRRALALMVIEAEDAREQAEQRALVAEARAESTQLILDNVNRGDGIVVREWLKKYFPPRQEQKLWALFYAKRMLKNGLGQGSEDKHGKRRPSRDHQTVLTDGQGFFIRLPKKKDYVGDGVKRYETFVRPGRAELELVAYCEKHGIAPLPEVSQALFEINDLSTVFASQKELAA